MTEVDCVCSRQKTLRNGLNIMLGGKHDDESVEVLWGLRMGGILKLMSGTAALEAFTVTWICGTNSPYTLRLRKPMENLDAWFQGQSQLRSSVFTFHIQIYFPLHIQNPVVLPEYWEHRNHTVDRLFYLEHNADCITWLGTWPCRQMWFVEETSLRRT